MRSGAIPRWIFLGLFAAWAGCVSRTDTGELPYTGSKLVASQPSAVADPNAPLTVSAYVRDNDGTPQANVVVALNSPSRATISPNQAISDEDGVASFAVSSNTIGPAPLQLWAQTSLGWRDTSARLTVFFVNPKLPPIATLGLTVTPSVGSVDDTSVRRLIAVAQDSQGAPVSSAALTFTSSRAADLITPPGGLTDDTGRLTAILSSTRAGTASITVSDGITHQATAPAVFYAGLPDAGHIFMLSLDDDVMAGDGVTPNPATVFVGDRFGNPVADSNVAFSPNSVVGGQSSQAVYVVPGSGHTDANGQFHTTVLTTQQGNATLVLGAGPWASHHNVIFRPGPANVSQSTFHVSPNEQVANGQSTIQLDIMLRDAAGHPRYGDVVQFTSGHPSDTFAPPTVQLNPQGAASTWVVSAIAGARSLAAVSPTLTPSVQAAFVPGPLSVTQSQLWLSPNVVNAGASAPTTAYVRLSDANNNPLYDTDLTLSGSCGGFVATPSQLTTDAQGLAQASVWATDNGLCTVSATIGTDVLTALLRVRPGSVDGNTSSLVGPTTGTPADGSSVAPLWLNLRDTWGNLVNDADFTAAITGRGTSLDPCRGTSTEDQQTLFSARSTAVGTAAVSVTTGGITLGANVPFVAGPTDLTQSRAYALPSSAPVDAQAHIAVGVVLRDAQGNPRTPLTVTFASSNGSDVMTPPSGVTDANGQVVAHLAGTAAGPRQVQVVSGAFAATLNVVLSPGTLSASTSTLTVVPTAPLADGAHPASVQLVARDAYGNALANVPVTLTASGGTLAAQGVRYGASTDASGTLTVPWTLSQLGNALISAQSSNWMLSQPVTALAGPPVLARSLVSVTPTPTPAGQPNVAATLTLIDAAGHPVANAMCSPEPATQAAYLSPSHVASDATGRVSFAVTSTLVGAQNLLVDCQGNDGSLVTFAVPVLTAAAAADLAQSTLSFFSPTVVADGLSQATYTLQLRDRFGNAAANVPVTLTTSSHSASLTPNFALTASDGRITGFVTDTHAEPVTLTALSNGTTLSATTSFIAGSINAAHSSLSVEPTQLIADGSSTAAIGVVLADAQGNPISGATVTFTLTGNGTLTPPSGVTSASGAFAGFVQTAQAGNLTLSAQSGNLTLGPLALTAVAGPASGATSTLLATPNEVVGDGNAAITLTLVVRDASNNPLVHAPITWSPTLGTLVQPPAQTDAAGMAQAQLTSTALGEGSVLATLGNLVLNADVNFIVGPPSEITSVLVAESTCVPANGVDSVPVALTVRDALGHPLPNFAVTLISSDANAWLTPPSGLTDGAGRYFSLLTSRDVGTETVTANANSAWTLATQANFCALDANNSHISLSMTPNTFVADGLHGTTITVVVANNLDTPLAQVPVTLSGIGAFDSLVPPSGTTDANGTFSATLTTTQARILTLRATTANLSALTTAAALPGEANATQSRLLVVPNIITGDGVSEARLELALRDAFGNALPNQNVTFGSTGQNVCVLPRHELTNADGNCQALLRTAIAGSLTASASSGNITLFAPITVVPGPLAAGTSTVSASPPSVIADGASTLTLRGSGRDASGNAEPNVTVTIAPQAGETFVGLPVTLSLDANGNFSYPLTSTLAQSVNLVVQLGAVSLKVPVTFLAGAPDPNHTTWVLSAPTAIADGQAPLRLTATLADAFGNPASHVWVAASSDGNNIAVTPNAQFTSATGSASFIATSPLAQAANFVASAANNAVTLSTAGSFVAGPVSLLTSSWTVSPSALVADGVAPAQASLTLRDGTGNPVGGVPVAFGVASSCLVTPSTGITDSQGHTATSLTDTVAELAHALASFGGNTLAAPVLFVAGAIDANHSSLVISTSQVLDGQSGGATLIAILRDRFGNPVGNELLTIASDGNAVVASPTGVTDANGRFSAALNPNLGLSQNVVATAQNVILSTVTPTFIGPVSAAMSSMLISPNFAVADGNMQVNVTLLARDRVGIPADHRGVTLTTPQAGVSISPTSGMTDATGTWLSQLIAHVAGDKTLHAMVDGVMLSGNVTFVAGPPDFNQSNFVISPTSVVADGQSAATLRVSLRDMDSNPAGNVPIFLASSDGDGVLAVPNGVTDANGIFTTTLASTHAGATTVVASVGNTLSYTGAVVFVPGPVDANHLHLCGTPHTITADGISTATLELRAKDAFNNPIVNANVTWTQQMGLLTPLSTTTDALGRATSRFVGTVSGNVLISATVQNVTVYDSLRLVPGQPAASLSSLSATPNSVWADGQAQLLLTVIARDPFNNLVPNQAVSWQSLGQSTTIVPQSPATDANAMATAFVSSLLGQSEVLAATLGSANLRTNVTFVPVASQGASTLSATPNVVTADGQQASQLVLTVRELLGNPVVGQAVTLSASGANGILSTTQALSDAQGQVTFTLKSPVAGLKQVTAQLPNFALMTPVLFVPGPVALPASNNASGTALTLTPNVNSADASVAAGVVLTLTDGQGNPAPGQPVTFLSTVPNDTFASPSGISDANGQVATSVVGHWAGPRTVTAQTGNLSVAAPLTLVPGILSTQQSLMVSQPNTLVADGHSAVITTLLLRDAWGNPRGNDLVTFVAQGSALGTSALTSPSDANGRATLTSTSTLAQSANVCAQADNQNFCTSVTFLAGAANATVSTLSASPQMLVADGVSSTTLLISVRDALGNPLTQTPVVWSTSGQNIVLTPNTTLTDVNGQSTLSVSSTAVQQTELIAATGNIVLSVPVTFTVGAPSLTSSYLAITPNTFVTADNQSVALISACINDALGHPIANQNVVLATNGVGDTLVPSAGVTAATGCLSSALLSRVAAYKQLSMTSGNLLLNANVQFVAGAPDANHFLLSITPSALVAGSQNVSFAVTVRDAFNNVLPNQNGVLSVSDSQGRLAAQLAFVTDANGQTQLSNAFWPTTSGIDWVQVLSGAAIDSATLSVQPGAVSSFISTLSITPNQLLASDTNGACADLIVRDMFGNRVPNQNVVFSTAGVNVNLAPIAGVSDANGHVRLNVLSPAAQSTSVAAALGNVIVTGNVTFLPAPPDANHFVFTVTPPALPAGSGNVSIQLVVRDRFNNIVPNANATITLAQAQGGPGAAWSGTTDGNGSFNLNNVFAPTVAGTASLSATALGAVATTTLQVQPGAISAVTSTLTAAPPTLTVSATANTLATLTLKDAFGNAVPGQTVTLASLGNAVNLSAPSVITDSNGQAQFAANSIIAQTTSLNAQAGNVSLSVPVQFVPGAADANHFTLSVTPPALSAGAQNVTIAVTVRDALNNPVPNQNAILRIYTAQGTLDGQYAVVTDANGQASLPAGYYPTHSGIELIQASAQAASANVTLSVTSAAISPITSSLSISPNVLGASNSNTALVTISLRDAFNNPVIAQNVTLTTPGVAVALASNALVTDATGLAQTTVSSPVAQLTSVLATAANVPLSASVRFHPGAADANHFTLSASPAALSAGAQNVTLAVTIRDALDNPVPNQNTTLRIYTALGVLDGQYAVVTDANGQATLPAGYYPTHSGSELVQASAQAARANITLSVAPAAISTATSSLVVSPNALGASNSNTALVSISLRDAFNNPVAAQNVLLTTPGLGLVLASTALVTDATGSAQTTVLSPIAQLTTLTATAANVLLTTSVQFNPGAADANHFTLSASPASLSAGAQNVTLALTVRDALNNPVPNQNATLRIYTAQGALDGQYTVVTDANGQAILPAAYFPTHSGTELIQASAQAASTNITLSVVPAAISTATSSLVVSPNALGASNSNTALVTISLRDAFNNPVTAQNVILTTPGLGLVLASNTLTTDATGSAQTTVLSPIAQVTSLTATAANVLLTTSVQFNPGAADANHFTLSASPASLSAGAQNVTLALTVRDALNNPVPNQNATLRIYTAQGALDGQYTVVTDANGQAILPAAYFPTHSGTELIQASAQAASTNITLSVVPAAISTATSSLVVSPNALGASNSNTALVTISLRDAFNNPVSAQNVILTTPGLGLVLASNTLITDATGSAQTTVLSPVAQMTSLSASAGNVVLSAPVRFNPGAADANHFTLSASPSALSAGAQNVTLTVTVRDALNNPVPNQNTVLRVYTALGVLDAQYSLVSDANGQATLPAGYYPTHSGTEIVQASAQAASANITLSITPAAISALTSSFVVSPNALGASNSNTALVLLNLRDAFGNPVSAQNVTVTTPGIGIVLASNALVTDATGAAQTTVSSPVAQLTTLLATAANVPLSAAVRFNPGPADANHVTLSASPAALSAGAQNVTLALTVRDLLGNPVPNQNATLRVYTALGALDGQYAVVTDANGQATLPGAYYPTHSGTELVQASVQAVNTNVTLSVVPAAISSLTSSLTVSPNTLGVSNGNTALVTVSLRDAFNNPVAAQNVTVTTPGVGLVLASNTLITDSTGTAQTTVFSPVAQLTRLVASAGNVTLSGNLQLTAGLPDPARLTFVASPNQLIAGAGNVTLQVIVRDSFGNLLPQQNVTLRAYTQAGVLDGTYAAQTDANGQVTLAGIYSPIHAGAETVTLVDGALSANIPLLIVPAAATSATSTLAISPNVLTVSNSNQALVTLTVRDAYSNLVPNQNVTFTSAGVGMVLSSASGITDANGQVQIGARSLTAQATSINALCGNATLLAPLTLLPGAVDANHSSFVVTPATLTAGAANVSVSAVLRDIYNNVVPNQSATLTFTTSAGVTDRQLNVTSDANGAISLTNLFAPTYAGAEGAQLVAGPAQKNASVTINAGLATAAQSTLVVSPNALSVSNINTTLATLLALDAYRNPAGNQVVSWTSPGSLVSLVSPVTVTNANGIATLGVRSPLVQMTSVSANVGNANLTAGVQFLVGAPNTALSSIAASPNQVTADGATNTTVTSIVRDAFGNPVPNQSVLWSSSGQNMVMSSATSTTDANGRASITVSSTAVQGTSVTALAGTANLTVPLTFVAGAPNLSQSLLYLAVDTNNNSLLLIDFYLHDTQGHPIAAANVTIGSSGAGDIVSPITGITDSSGHFGTSVLSGLVSALGGLLSQTSNVVVTVNGNSIVANVKFNLLSSPTLVSKTVGGVVTTLNQVIATAGAAVKTLLSIPLDADGGALCLLASDDGAGGAEPWAAACDAPEPYTLLSAVAPSYDEEALCLAVDSPQATEGAGVVLTPCRETTERWLVSNGVVRPARAMRLCLVPRDISGTLMLDACDDAEGVPFINVQVPYDENDEPATEAALLAAPAL